MLERDGEVSDRAVPQSWGCGERRGEATIWDNQRYTRWTAEARCSSAGMMTWGSDEDDVDRECGEHCEQNMDTCNERVHGNKIGNRVERGKRI